MGRFGGIYSTIELPPNWEKARSNIRTIDGNSVIQELGYIGRWTFLFSWINRSELQNEIDDLQAKAEDGWAFEGPVRKTQVVRPLNDLFEAEVTLIKYSDTPI